MPIDDLTALGQKMREARKNKELTQQELSDTNVAGIFFLPQSLRNSPRTMLQ